MMKLHPKTLYDAILPILILNWFTGMTLFEYPLRNPQFALSLVYILINISAYCCAYSHDPFKEITDQDGNKQIIYKLLKNANLFISACCVLIGCYYSKASKIVIKRIELLDEALDCLGLQNNYRQIFVYSLLKTFMWVSMIGTVILLDVYLLSQRFDFVKCLHLCYLLHYPTQLNSVVDFTFTLAVNYMALKFESINLLLKRILSIDPKPENVEKLYKKHSRISVLIMSTERSDILNNTERQKKLIILIKHLHMEATKISFQINKMFQTQILMVLIAFLASTVGFLYIFFSVIFFGDKKFPGNLRFILSIAGWCAFYVYRLLNLNSTCGRLSSESRRTREILCEMRNTIQNAELKEEIEQFSLQLTHQPLVFTVCGFTTLDYPLVQGFMETVTTYLVLLIHFSPEIKR